jgi:23S rRNA (guanosine2251-2'-O)-methyltransferase
VKKLQLDELNRLSVDQFKGAAKIPVSLVLDNIRSRMPFGLKKST